MIDSILKRPFLALAQRKLGEVQFPQLTFTGVF